MQLKFSGFTIFDWWRKNSKANPPKSNLITELELLFGNLNEVDRKSFKKLKNYVEMFIGGAYSNLMLEFQCYSKRILYSHMLHSEGAYVSFVDYSSPINCSFTISNYRDGGLYLSGSFQDVGMYDPEIYVATTNEAQIELIDHEHKKYLPIFGISSNSKINRVINRPRWFRLNPQIVYCQDAPEQVRQVCFNFLTYEIDYLIEPEFLKLILETFCN